MKFLVDTGDSHVSAFGHDTAGKQTTERIKVGKNLLHMFLKDGKIRGQTPAGEIYEHDISPGLARRFIGKLKGIRVKGVRLR